MKLSVLIYIPFFLLIVSCAFKKKESISYPEPIPDSAVLTFLPGVVSSDSLDFNSAFSPDGKIFYFCRAKKGKWDIYQVTLNADGKYTTATAPFSEAQYSQADPFILADGTIYYISNRPKNESDTLRDYDIWKVHPRGDGTWSEPENIEGVNSDSTEYYVSIASNGNLYFASTRKGSYGGLDLYVSKLVNGKYTSPENLGASINTATDEHDPLITPDDQSLIFTSYNRPGGFGEADLYYSQKKNDQWLAAQNMGKRFNTPTYEYCPNFSPDGKYFFYSSEYDVKWIDSDHLPFHHQIE
jgi:Tol biopolymer transport system component